MVRQKLLEIQETEFVVENKAGTKQYPVKVSQRQQEIIDFPKLREAVASEDLVLVNVGFKRGEGAVLLTVEREFLVPKEGQGKVSRDNDCPKDFHCPECGTRLEQQGHYNVCTECNWKCRWFTNAGGLGGTAQELDMYESLPR